MLGWWEVSVVVYLASHDSQELMHLFITYKVVQQQGPSLSPSCHGRLAATLVLCLPKTLYLFAGDCSATVFPFSRLDGAVVEVLLRDGGGWQRIVTAQARPAAPGSVRLKGSTIKACSCGQLERDKRQSCDQGISGAWLQARNKHWHWGKCLLVAVLS